MQTALQSLVYNVKHDGALKCSVKNGHSIEEALDAEDIREEVEEMDRQVVQVQPAVNTLLAAEGPEADSLAGPASAVVKMALGEVQFAKVRNLAEEKQEIVAEHLELARRVVAENVKLVDGSDKDSTLVSIIRASPVGQIRGGEAGYVIVHYDVKLAGEASSLPQYRSPPARKVHIEKLIRAVLRSRLSPEAPLAISPGDVFMMFDGGKPMCHSLLLGAFAHEVPAQGQKTRPVAGGPDDEARVGLVGAQGLYRQAQGLFLDPPT